MQELFWTFLSFFIYCEFSTNVQKYPVNLPNKWFLKNRTLGVDFTEQVPIDVFIVLLQNIKITSVGPLPWHEKAPGFNCDKLQKSWGQV
jgi:hypothetical protein